MPKQNANDIRKKTSFNTIAHVSALGVLFQHWRPLSFYNLRFQTDACMATGRAPQNGTGMMETNHDDDHHDHHHHQHHHYHQCYMYLSIYLSIYRSIDRSIYRSIYLSIYLPTYLSICVYMYMCERVPTHARISAHLAHISAHLAHISAHSKCMSSAPP